VAVLSGWYPVALAAWAIGFGCILVRGNDPFSRLLGLVRTVLLMRPLQWLGKISYPLYLIHWPVLIGMLYLILRFSPGLSSLHAAAILTATAIPVMLIAAEMIHRTVEKPGMALGKRFERRPKTETKPETKPESGD